MVDIASRGWTSNCGSSYFNSRNQAENIWLELPPTDIWFVKLEYNGTTHLFYVPRSPLMSMTGVRLARQSILLFPDYEIVVFADSAATAHINIPSYINIGWNYYLTILFNQFKCFNTIFFCILCLDKYCSTSIQPVIWRDE